MRIVFMGTPDFAVPCLQALLQQAYDVVGVFTQPDKPKGRGYKMIPPPVKAAAVEAGLSVYQPLSLRKGEEAEQAMQTLQELNPDVIVVVAYGQILPKAVLDLPKYGCINIHGSLLPAYRGAAPMQMCLLNGETETGVTSMQMAEGLDTGDMLVKAALPIGADETFEHRCCWKHWKSWKLEHYSQNRRTMQNLPMQAELQRKCLPCTLNSQQIPCTISFGALLVLRHWMESG